ncbi:UDP-N-acetyl-D-glucosamine 6-dehydrogenase [compost metagenome]
MGEYVASQVVKLMIKKEVPINGANLLMLGITFKENCPDVRNTKIVDVIKALSDYGIKVTIFDPLANTKEVEYEYGLSTISKLPDERFDAVVLGVAHKEFFKIDFTSVQKSNSVLYDVKGCLGNSIDGRL